MATVWMLWTLLEGLSFEVRNHQELFVGDFEAGSGALNEFRRGGIIISGAKTIARIIYDQRMW